MTTMQGAGGRARTAVVAAVAAAALLLSSAAWACTAVMGKLTLTPSSGTIGSKVLTSASGLKVKPAKYRIIFKQVVTTVNGVTTYVGGDCHASTVTDLRTGVPTDSSGRWSNVEVLIPSTAKRGTATICGRETYPVKDQTATTHETFTVV